MLQHTPTVSVAQIPEDLFTISFLTIRRAILDQAAFHQRGVGECGLRRPAERHVRCGSRCAAARTPSVPVNQTGELCFNCIFSCEQLFIMYIMVTCACQDVRLHSLFYFLFFLQDLVSRELLRCMRTFFTSRAHILKAVPDLAVIGVAEVNNFLAEGSLWQDDLFSSLQLEDSAVKATVLNGEACMAESIHMDEATDSAKNPDSGGAPDIPVSALVHALQRQVCELLKMKTTGDSPAGVLLSRLQKDFSCDKGAHCPQEKVSLYAALAGLHLCRRLFYEAQVKYYRFSLHFVQCATNFGVERTQKFSCTKPCLHNIVP